MTQTNLRIGTNFALAAALVITAACAKKPANLPPPPPRAETPGNVTPPPSLPSNGGTTDAAIGSTAIPGSVADFVAQSGSDRVLFGYDSYELDETARAVLGKQSEWLARYSGVKITIEGHTDERGTREYNLALGDRRANAAKNFLAAQGVAPARIATISYGKERPEAEGSDEAAYAKNRRAVTVILSGAR